MRIGLRIDVDTLRGTRVGVPELCRTLDRHGIRATFFFCVGPDNMGRHLWRLLRPRFAVKMLRTRAASLYGWDILLRGTFVPGPRIAERAAGAIRLAAGRHEIGLHAWDHHGWQKNVDRLTGAEVSARIERALESLERVAGRPVSCSAAPSWRCTDEVLRQKLRFDFRYNSDCRGRGLFLPLLDDGTIGQLQIPADLPTFDECVGRAGVSARGYYEDLLATLREDEEDRVLTIHAEVEGIVCSDLFSELVERALEEGHRFVPLCELIDEGVERPVARMVRGQVAGREGWVSCREPGVGSHRGAAAALSAGGARA